MFHKEKGSGWRSLASKHSGAMLSGLTGWNVLGNSLADSVCSRCPLCSFPVGPCASIHVAPDLSQENIQNVLIFRFIKTPVYLGGDQTTRRCRAVLAGFRIEGMRERSTVGLGSIVWRFKQQSDTCEVHGSTGCQRKRACPTDLHEFCGAPLIG